MATSDIVDIFRIDAAGFFAFRFSTGVFSLGVGVSIGAALVGFFGPSSIVCHLAVGAAVFALIVSSIVSMEDQQAIEEVLSTPLRAPQAGATSKEACGQLGETYSLSPRETEILELLAQGRDPVRIQDMLFVSYHTVRNHIKSIYRKLDVHSRQELLDLVEETMEAMPR